MPTPSAGHVKHSQATPALLSDDRTPGVPALGTCPSKDSVVWLGDPSHPACASQSAASRASAARWVLP